MSNISEIYPPTGENTAENSKNFSVDVQSDEYEFTTPPRSREASDLMTQDDTAGGSVTRSTNSILTGYQPLPQATADAISPIPSHNLSQINDTIQSQNKKNLDLLNIDAFDLEKAVDEDKRMLEFLNCDIAPIKAEPQEDLLGIADDYKNLGKGFNNANDPDMDLINMSLRIDVSEYKGIEKSSVPQMLTISLGNILEPLQEEKIDELKSNKSCSEKFESFSYKSANKFESQASNPFDECMPGLMTLSPPKIPMPEVKDVIIEESNPFEEIPNEEDRLSSLMSKNFDEEVESKEEPSEPKETDKKVAFNFGRAKESKPIFSPKKCFFKKLTPPPKPRSLLKMPSITPKTVKSETKIVKADSIFKDSIEEQKSAMRSKLEQRRKTLREKREKLRQLRTGRKCAAVEKFENDKTINHLVSRKKKTFCKPVFLKKNSNRLHHYFVPSWLYDRRGKYSFIDKFKLPFHSKHGFAEDKIFLCINHKFLSIFGLVRGKERLLKYTLKGLNKIIFNDCDKSIIIFKKNAKEEVIRLAFVEANDKRQMDNLYDFLKS